MEQPKLATACCTECTSPSRRAAFGVTRSSAPQPTAKFRKFITIAISSPSRSPSSVCCSTPRLQRRREPFFLLILSCPPHSSVWAMKQPNVFDSPSLTSSIPIEFAATSTRSASESTSNRQLVSIQRSVVSTVHLGEEACVPHRRSLRVTDSRKLTLRSSGG